MCFRSSTCSLMSSRSAANTKQEFGCRGLISRLRRLSLSRAITTSCRPWPAIWIAVRAQRSGGRALDCREEAKTPSPSSAFRASAWWEAGLRLLSFTRSVIREPLCSISYRRSDP